jgi:hypothetical protein
MMEGGSNSHHVFPVNLFETFAFLTFLGHGPFQPGWSWKNWRLHQDERKTPNPESPATSKSAARFTAVKMIMMSLFTSQKSEATFAFGNFEHKSVKQTISAGLYVVELRHAIHLPEQVPCWN